MERINRTRAAWWIGGALLAGAAFAGLRRAFAFDIEIDPWDESYYA